ncbi:hypothetical protein DRH27_00365 [Candidatus Falkowbacteria bacterium]|nr:MAG: hypothetical protein DRH27_00365 [Candidatus Falkowbacteria bacterium]
MTITELIPYGIIKSQIKVDDNIGLVSCNSCVKFCETGGEEKMAEMAERLKKDGYKIVDTDLIGVACDLDQVKKETFDGDVIIVFGCDAAVDNIKKLAPDKKVLPALDTIGIGTRDREGNLSLVKRF